MIQWVIHDEVSNPRRDKNWWKLISNLKPGLLYFNESPSHKLAAQFKNIPKGATQGSKKRSKTRSKQIAEKIVVRSTPKLGVERMAVFSACRRVVHMFSAGLLSYLSLLKPGRSCRFVTEPSMSNLEKDHVGKILHKESATKCDRLPKECKCGCTWALHLGTASHNMYMQYEWNAFCRVDACTKGSLQYSRRTSTLWCEL